MVIFGSKEYATGMLEGEEGAKFLVESYLPEQAWKDQNLLNESL